MRYLNTKPGSIEEVAANMSKYAAESEYQDMFKKELEKAGKGIGGMTPAEKKAFFNKIDSPRTTKRMPAQTRCHRAAFVRARPSASTPMMAK